MSALFFFDEDLLLDQESLVPPRERDEKILEELQSFKKAICYYDFKGAPPYNSANWKEYTYPLLPLQGKQSYYWTYVPCLPYFPKEGIISFNKYAQQK